MLDLEREKCFVLDKSLVSMKPGSWEVRWQAQCLDQGQ